MFTRVKAIFAASVVLMPLAAVPAFAQAEGPSGVGSYLGSEYRMDDTPAGGGVSSFNANNNVEIPGHPTSKFAAQQPSQVHAQVQATRPEAG